MKHKDGLTIPVKVSFKNKSGEKLSEHEGVLKIEELCETKVVPSIKVDKAKELKVGKYVLTNKKLRVLSGVSVKTGHRSRIHGILGDRVKIDYNKAHVWVNKNDVSIEV